MRNPDAADRWWWGMGVYGMSDEMSRRDAASGLAARGLLPHGVTVATATDFLEEAYTGHRALYNDLPFRPDLDTFLASLAETKSPVEYQRWKSKRRP